MSIMVIVFVEFIVVLHSSKCLQWFDAVGCVAERTSRLVKNRVVGCWHGCLSGASCRLAYGPADVTATHCLLLQ